MALSLKDVGIKVAQAGYNVETAADYQLLFNSAWPSLQIAYDKTFHVTAGTTVTVEHNLGFYPFAFGFAMQSGTLLGRIGYAALGTLAFYIGLNHIYIQGDGTADYDVNVVCYNVDLGKSADYTQPLPSGLGGSYSPDYGIRVVKTGRDIDSTDLRDFLLHTRAQSPALLAVLNEENAVRNGTNWDISYANPVGTPNWIHGFLVTTGVTYEPRLYLPAGMAVQQATGVTISGPNYRLTYGEGQGGTIVVLRDPLFGSLEVTATY